MRIIKRLLIEIGVVILVMMAFVASYVVRNESTVGKSEEQILEMAIEKNDYVVAREIYENIIPRRSDVAGVPTASDLEMILGATTDNENIEMMIYPKKRIAAEIMRLEELLQQYPTYPPLLTQLQKLYTEIGDNPNAEKYERELERLNIH